MSAPRLLRRRVLAVALAAAVLLVFGWAMAPVFAAEPKPAAPPFADESAAHALYNQMIDAMRKATSLSYVSRYQFEARGKVLMSCTYRAWLKKPNYFRIETEKPTKGKGGTLIGDGNTLWIYWPEGRPQFSYGFEYDEPKADRETRNTSYMKKPAPPGGHSIGHETGILGAGMSMPVIDPSTFHGYTDSLQAYLDGVKGLPAEKVGTEDCDKIEVSIMKGQRSRYLWLSKRDHLPRKLREVVRVSYDLVIEEQWSSVTLNGDMPDTLFAWKPPEGWKEWRLPRPEERLLKPGTQAPDFDLASAEGKRIKLSGYRGQVVWFYIWRAG